MTTRRVPGGYAWDAYLLTAVRAMQEASRQLEEYKTAPAILRDVRRLSESQRSINAALDDLLTMLEIQENAR